MVPCQCVLSLSSRYRFTIDKSRYLTFNILVWRIEVWFVRDLKWQGDEYYDEGKTEKGTWVFH